MSMELYVLSDEQLPSIEAWQQAIDAAGFSLRLSTERPFAALRGALPVMLGDRATSFECDHWSAATLMAEMPDVAFGQGWSYALAFRWGADFDAGAATYMAASAYATATGGRVFDCAEGKLISPQRAGDIAREFEQSGPLVEEAVRRAMEKRRN
uniref:Uncharacterized protein n=1 Tax=Rhodopseudomonas palustris (strain BisA53) TaxID=316055 RepID=Q07I66_RHOP5